MRKLARYRVRYDRMTLSIIADRSGCLFASPAASGQQEQVPVKLIECKRPQLQPLPDRGFYRRS